VLVGLAALVASPAVASASPQAVIGFGSRAVAMGGTGIAAAEGADAVYTSPALLSAARATELTLGFQGANFDVEVEGPGMRGPLELTPLRATTLGAVVPLPFTGALARRVAIGLCFVTPTDVVVRARILYPERPQVPLADRVQSVALQAGVGVDVGHGVRLGAGLAALAALEGSVVVRTDASGRVGTEVRDTLVASYAPVFAASWETGDGRYRVGSVVRGPLVGRFDVVIRAEDLGSITIPPLHISGVAQYDPWQVGLEYARAEGPYRLALGLTYSHWQDYPGPAEATVRCDDAPDGGADCAAPVPSPPRFIGVVSPRIGVERAFELDRGTSVKLRGGVSFEPSPAPEQRGRANLFDMHRTVLAAGWGAQFGLLPLSVDGFFQAQVLHAREHDKDPSRGASEAGVITTRGLVLASGLSLTARLR
jgi:long-chain fatty acid transport protein